MRPSFVHGKEFLMLTPVLDSEEYAAPPRHARAHKRTPRHARPFVGRELRPFDRDRLRPHPRRNKRRRRRCARPGMHRRRPVRRSGELHNRSMCRGPMLARESARRDELRSEHMRLHVKLRRCRHLRCDARSNRRRKCLHERRLRHANRRSDARIPR